MTDATEWQPIDTVPTDGRLVDVWDEKTQIFSFRRTPLKRGSWTHWHEWDQPTDAAPQRDLT